MIITTTPTIEGQSIKHYLGVVNANFVIGTNFFSDFAASFTDFFGGFSDSYQNKLAKIYQMVMKEVETRAQGLGADAIVGLRIDFDEISGKDKSMFMVTATGTAVSLLPDLDGKHKMLKKLSELYDYKTKGLLSTEEYESEKEQVIAIYQGTIGETLQIVQEKEAAIRKRKEEAERIAYEQLKIKEKERLATIEGMFEFMNEKCSLDKINSISESELENVSFSLPYDNNDNMDIIIAKLLRVNRVAEACKYYMEETGLSLADAKEFVSDIFLQLDTIDIENYEHLLNKLRVLKGKGLFEQAIDLIREYSFADAALAKQFIEKLS